MITWKGVCGTVWARYDSSDPVSCTPPNGSGLWFRALSVFYRASRIWVLEFRAWDFGLSMRLRVFAFSCCSVLVFNV